MNQDHQSSPGNHQEMLLESSLESVDAAEAATMEFASGQGMDEDGLNQLGMAVRECLVNAVVHGNRYNENKRVHFSLAADQGQVVVMIGDEGDGFDPSALPDPLAEENLMRQSGRGILLMRAFVDELDITRRQPHGTQVRLAKKIE